MCTAIAYTDDHFLFGRTLDLEYRYDERVTLTPHRYPFTFSDGTTNKDHSALLGMAYVYNGYPLYYDAMNDQGLAMAGLAFSGYAHYPRHACGKNTIAPYELIPYVLSHCRTAEDARRLLSDKIIADIPISEALSNQPMHWMIADRRAALVVEQTADGLQLYDNPVGVLTNAPPFPHQLDRLRDYRHLSPRIPENTFSDAFPLNAYSRGMGGIGLPGDWSSPSRFVRAAFIRSHIQPSGDSAVTRFFRILDGVSVPAGCVLCDDGTVRTIYTSCCDVTAGIYSHMMYESRDIHFAAFVDHDTAGTELITV